MQDPSVKQFRFLEDILTIMVGLVVSMEVQILFRRSRLMALLTPTWSPETLLQNVAVALPRILVSSIIMTTCVTLVRWWWFHYRTIPRVARLQAEVVGMLLVFFAAFLLPYFLLAVIGSSEANPLFVLMMEVGSVVQLLLQSRTGALILYGFLSYVGVQVGHLLHRYIQ